MRPRSPALLIAGLAPITLLAVDPWGWYPFGPVKWLAVSALVPAGAVWVLARRPLRVAVAPTCAAVALVAWLAVAAALGRDGIYAWIGTPERHLGVLAWALTVLALVVGQSLDHDDRRTVAAGLVAAGLGVGVVSVAEAAGWEPRVLDVGVRLSGPLGSPAFLGAAAALLLPALAGVAADASWDRRARCAAVAGTVGLAVAAVGSGARAAWVGLAAAAVVTAWAHRSRLTRRPRAAGLAGAAALVAVAVLAVAGPVGARAASTFDPDASGGRGRLDEWRVAARVVADQPLAGVGPEGYRIAFAEGVDAAYARAHGRDPVPDRAHSAPLDVALAGGVPALVVWLVLVALVAPAVLAAVRGDRPWLAGIGAGLVAHVTGGLFLFPVVELEPLAWLLAGLVLAARPSPAPAPSTARRVEWPVPMPALAVLGGLAALGLVAGLADVTADRHARRAADALAAGDGAAAASAARASTGLRPDTVRLHLLDGRARVADQQGFTAALASVDRARALSPGDPVVRLEGARLLVARAEATRSPDHIDRSRAEVERLLAGDPLHAELWSLAAVASDLDGDRRAAEEALRRAEALARTERDGT